MATLTIRKLDESVKQKLRMAAARHGRSMEAEARSILARSLAGGGGAEASGGVETPERFGHLRGAWKDRFGDRSTREIIEEIRGIDDTMETDQGGDRGRRI